MPPIRRYLRITRHSVLEVRIYLDNPADAQRWLLSPRDPVLPRVIAAVRPLVLPKLREENQLAAKKGKGGKKKGWKDVVVEGMHLHAFSPCPCHLCRLLMAAGRAGHDCTVHSGMKEKAYQFMVHCQQTNSKFQSS